MGENCEGTEHARIMRAHEKAIPLAELETHLALLQKHIETFNHKELFNALKHSFVEFNAADNTEDLLHYMRSTNVVQLKTNKHTK